jgi:hypothetical protein
MVPRADDQKMFRACIGRGIRNVIAIKCHRAEFVAIVLTGDRENWQRDLLELVNRRNHRVIVRVGHRMF